MIGITGSELDINSLKQRETAEAERNRTELGQEEFLSLMLTQLRNQDPFEPLDNGEFIGQMAQFSTVSGIADLTTSFETLANSLYTGQALQASTMIGRSVLTAGNQAVLEEGGTLQGGVDIPNSTSTGFVRISTPTGQLVRELPLGDRGPGLANFEWDGIGANGAPAAPGQYVISAGYRDNAEEVALGTFVTTKVASVSLSAGGTNTSITTEDGQELSLTEVKAVL